MSEATVRIDTTQVPEIVKARLVNRLLDGINAAFEDPEKWAVIDKRAKEVKAWMKGGGDKHDG